ncbi:MAG: hypothetical protein CBB62_10505 [Micavibrio sp. TMED2]|nr:hypothetical protein [Alphaproteobacteria bacterium]OUT40211.1 MAG: hypothetical protein CBB62_10505 [Micavibrio sp. TMED2]
MSPTPASSEENPLVHISAARLEQYRAHRQMVDQMFEQIGSFVNDLGTKGYPVKFERLSPKEGAQRAAMKDKDDKTLVELHIDRIRPVMLYPTDVMERQQQMQGAMRQRMAAQQNMMDGPDDDDGPAHPLQPKQPMIPGPDTPILVHNGAGAVSMSADGEPSEGGVEKKGPKPRSKPMTVEEVREAVEANGGELPEGMSLPPGAIVMDPTRGMPPSPVATDALSIKVFSNMNGQPEEIAIVYDMTDPVKNHSLLAHLADVAAFAKDLHEQPVADRTDHNSPYRNDHGIGFRRPGP